MMQKIFEENNSQKLLSSCPALNAKTKLHHLLTIYIEPHRLAADPFSIPNFTYVTPSILWPYCIDLQCRSVAIGKFFHQGF